MILYHIQHNVYEMQYHLQTLLKAGISLQRYTSHTIMSDHLIHVCVLGDTKCGRSSSGS